MSIAQSNEPTRRKPLRLWPGVLATVIGWLTWFAVPIVLPDYSVLGVLGGVAGGLGVLVWWLFFSRARWYERVGAIVVMVVAVFATTRLVHESISNGMMGMMLPFFSIPVLGLALVAWAVACGRLSGGPRSASLVAAIALACGAFTLIRTGGITGTAESDLHWRWTPTPEERLLAQAEPPLPVPPPAAPEARETPIPSTPHGVSPSTSLGASAPVPPTASAAAKTEPAAPSEAKTNAEWPGFRGPERDSLIRGVRLETDWSQKPPVELWRRPIGPGWSSFAVHGNLFYTQEQRGEDEIVSAYNLKTGEPVWRHRDPVRFWESNGGAGPRATPTLSNGRVYSLGATGVLNALDARDGSVVWSRNAASDTGAQLPGWGFAGSPLVVGDTVIVATSGRLASYDIATGKPRWVAQTLGGSYSSPHLATIDGVEQILMLSGGGATSVAPADGTKLWEHPGSGSNVVQPALTAEGDVLVGAMDSSASGVGTVRIAIAHGEGGWSVHERWTSRGLKPSFNDFVVHKGHAFGFDGSILASIDLQDGKRNWKGGRYGNGQLVLLSDQDLLLVVSEEGELALVGATPDQFREIARVPALDGKTWNHPVLVGDVLLVRNGEEMAAFRLSLAGR